MEIKTANDLVLESTSISAKFVSGQVQPDAIVAVIDKNSNVISTIVNTQLETTNEETGQQTLWIMIEEL